MSNDQENAEIEAFNASAAAKFDKIAANIVELETRRVAVVDAMAYLATLTEPDGEISDAIGSFANLLTLLIDGGPLPDHFTLVSWRSLAEQAQLELSRAAMVMDDMKAKMGGK